MDMSERYLPTELSCSQGRLDMLILRTLLFGPATDAGWRSASSALPRTFCRLGRGSLCLALHRLERKRWVVAKWEMWARDRRPRVQMLPTDRAGKKQLVVEEWKWEQLTGAMGRMMWPAQEG